MFNYNYFFKMSKHLLQSKTWDFSGDNNDMEVRIKMCEFKAIVEQKVQERVSELKKRNDEVVETRVNAQIRLNDQVVEQRVVEELKFRLFKMEKEFQQIVEKLVEQRIEEIKKKMVSKGSQTTEKW